MNSAAKNARNGMSPDIGMISLDELRQLRKDTEKGTRPDAMIMTKDDLERIKNAKTIRTVEDIKREKKEKETMRENQQKTATLRKKKMLQLDEERATKVPLSDIGLENKQREEMILARAQMLLDEQMDDVKHMNKMVLYSQVVTVRDKQLE